MIRLTGAKGMKITVAGEKMRESSCFPNSTPSGCIAENTLKKVEKILKTILTLLLLYQIYFS